jgi:DNA-binding FrmR family transcriptional regulator
VVCLDLTEASGRYGYAPRKNALLKRLARAEGQVRGVARMIEQDRYCIEILTQLAAVDTALEGIALTILEDHVRHCVAGALTSDSTREAETKIDELLAAVGRFAKTR